MPLEGRILSFDSWLHMLILHDDNFGGPIEFVLYCIPKSSLRFDKISSPFNPISLNGGRASQLKKIFLTKNPF